MKYLSKTSLLVVVLSLLFIVAPSVFAEEKTGQAVMKDLIIEENGIEHKVQEPIILFEGQNYIPLRVVTNSLGKNIYIDKITNQIVIENSQEPIVKKSIQSSDQHQFRPQLTFDEDVSSEGVIIIEDNEKNIMFEKNGFSTFYPASTTKVLTALLALERGNLTDKVIVSENVNKLPGDSRRVFIQPGDELTLEDLLYGMLLYSGNDSALAIAEHIAGSEDAFANLMNEKAKELGALHSNFVNPHGYHHPDHYTTPFDMAKILKAASLDSTFLEMINTANYKVEYKNKKGKLITRNWGTTNSFLKDRHFSVEGIIGGKTGYTNPAKRNLVTVAEYNGHRYYVVALKGDSLGRYIDTRKLLQHAYKVRETYDNQPVTEISVSFLKNAIEYGDRIIPIEGQSFEYKGRTYVTQSFLNQTFATIQQTSSEEKVVKINIQSRFRVYPKKALALTMAAKLKPVEKRIVENKLVSYQNVSSSNLKQPSRLLLGLNLFVFDSRFLIG